jgi:hypothetical protein
MAKNGHLPAELRTYTQAFTDALSEPLLAAWDESDDAPDFVEAEQPAAIARVLIKTAHHSHLANASIGYLYKKDIKGRGVVVWGRASKVGGKLAHYSHLDFLIEINWTVWRHLSPARRIALLDHELAHCGREDTEKGEKYVILPHDLEEFHAIARRWGAWRPSLADFANALGEGQQLGLFTHD